MFALSLRRTAVPFAGVALSVATLAGIAAAQYPPDAGSGKVSRSTVKRCQCVQFAGEGFRPGEQVGVTDGGVFVATVTADARGGFKVKVCFDERSAEGGHELRATGESREVVAAVEVRGDACREPAGEVGSESFDRLPRTGGDVTAAALLLGFGAMTTGSAAVYAARRRRLA